MAPQEESALPPEEEFELDSKGFDSFHLSARFIFAEGIMLSLRGDDEEPHRVQVTAQEHGASFLILNSKDSVRFSVIVNDGGAGISLPFTNDQGIEQKRVNISVDKTGKANCAFSDNEGRTRLTVKAGESECAVTIYDSQKHPRCTVEQKDDSGAVLYFLDENQKIRGAIGFDALGNPLLAEDIRQLIADRDRASTDQTPPSQGSTNIKSATSQG